LYQVDKNKLYETLFDNKKEVLKNYDQYEILMKELRYYYSKIDPFTELDNFLKPDNKGKEELKKILPKSNKNLIPNMRNITKENLMAWFSRKSKLNKDGAKLGYYTSWEVFADILTKNKNKIFKTIKQDNSESKFVVYNEQEALATLKKTLFETTHQRKRKVKKEYSLFNKAKTDAVYLHRRKDNNENWIYQVRNANQNLKGKGSKTFTKEKFKFKNIVPMGMDKYKQSFE
jgi:hypothetical protein